MLVALGILVLFVLLMVGMFIDLDRLRREVEIDELWTDEVDGGWASSGEFVATTRGSAPGRRRRPARRRGVSESLFDARPPGKGCYLSTLELHELDEACRPFLSAFGEHPYLVGSAGLRPDFRDVDVRLILADDEFDALFAERQGLWALLSRLGSTYLKERTGLRVDFQVQRQTEANAKYGNLGETPRNPLGSRSLLDFAGGGDAT